LYFIIRYETRSFDQPMQQQQQPQMSTTSEIIKIQKPITTSSNIQHDFSKMSLTNDGGNLSLIDGGSERLTSISQRVMERQTIATTTKSKLETKTQTHSYRLE